MLSARAKDSLRLLGRLSMMRAFNGALVFVSYFLSRAFRKPMQWGLPMSISIEPTTSCNLRCPECPSGLRSFTRPIGMLQEDLFSRIVSELKQKVFYLTLYFQGEPYLNPSFFDFVRIAETNGIYTATSTNAHFLNDERARKTVESGLSRLIISIDGTTQEVYQQYRIGGKLDKVLEGTRRIIAWKRKLKSQTPYVIFQFLVVKPNEHQISEAQQLADELGVDELKLKTAQVYDYKDGNPLIPAEDRYSRYKKMDDGTYEVKNKLLSQCWKMWHSCVLTWDGKVVPCCFDKDASHQMGSLQDKSFKEIWQGDAYRSFRTALLRSRKEIDICKNCTEGTQVWA